MGTGNSGKPLRVIGVIGDEDGSVTQALLKLQARRMQATGVMLQSVPSPLGEGVSSAAATEGSEGNFANMVPLWAGKPGIQ